MRRFIAVLFGLSVLAIDASAAPLWIERQFIPEPELIDPRFAEADDQSVEQIEHGVWAAFLEAFVVESPDGVNRVAYARVDAKAREALKRYIDALQAAAPSALSRDEQLAFWINLYNAATVDLILDAYPVSSIRKLDDPWARKLLTIDGVQLSLGDIEHHVVRALFDDPRIHYALNCASIGCTNLATSPYTGDALEEMLDAAARDYVNHPRGVAFDDDGDVDVSKIYGWYRDDFGGDEEAALEHIRTYAEPDLKARLEGVDDIDDYDYDWALNDAAPVSED
ncbi:MAG: DUF547 domain-containing protein [Pseudomonadota bacterium]